MAHLTDDERKLLDKYAPVKIGMIGYTGDSPELLQQMGALRAGQSVEITGGPASAALMALDEAFEAGRLPRRYEMIYLPDKGLPEGSAQNDVDAYNRLCDQGCLCVIGPHSSDNVYMLKRASEQRKVPVISWAGTEQLAGDYLFRLGNGDCGGDPALMAAWIQKNGFSKIGIVEELCPNGEEYMRYFRLECRSRELTVCSTETLSQFSGHETICNALKRMREAGTEVIAYIGYGYLLAQNLLNPALKEIGWDPARITTTAFMYYLNGFNNFEGWVGIDQDCPDNPLRNEFAGKYYERYKDLLFLDYRDNWLNGVQLLSYDTGRVVAEALFRAPRLTPEGMKEGLERIRWMDACVGGPDTHISCSAHEHNMYSGNWLCYGKIEDGKLKFEGLYR